MRRMDRYQEENPSRIKRSDKNKELYQDLANNPKYTNISDVTNSNAYELNTKETTPTPSRENYQQMRKYKDFEQIPKVKKDLEEFNYLYPKKEKKIYDINSVLEEARNSRNEKDELEEKRKLKYTSYNILAGVNLEELAKYREEKKKRGATPEEEEIHELMNTIASKTLAGELSKEATVELLSDLMATNMLDKVGSPEEIENEQAVMVETHEIVVDEPSENIKVEDVQELAEKTESTENSSENRKVDKDFYTKSMDLSDADLEMSDDFQDKGLPLGLKIFIILLIILVLVLAGYFIYLKIK